MGRPGHHLLRKRSLLARIAAYTEEEIPPGEEEGRKISGDILFNHRVSLSLLRKKRAQLLKAGKKGRDPKLKQATDAFTYVLGD